MSLATEKKKYTGEFYIAYMYRMNRSGKRQWIKALRSEQFLQGKQKLKMVDPHRGDLAHHCCLGVLCELNGYREKRPYGTSTVTFISPKGREENSFLPLELVEKYELRYNLLASYLNNTPQRNNPMMFKAVLPDGGVEFYSLAHLNDQGFTFNQIADLIDYFL